MAEYSPPMTKTHTIAWCNTCGWRFREQEGDRRRASAQADTHTEEVGHPTGTSMHPITDCMTHPKEGNT